MTATEEKRRLVISEAEQQHKDVETEKEGLLWLIDHGIEHWNTVYQSGGRFLMGWGDPVDPAELPELKHKLAGFPWTIAISMEGRVRITLTPETNHAQLQS